MFNEVGTQPAYPTLKLQVGHKPKSYGKRWVINVYEAIKLGIDNLLLTLT